MRSSTSQSCCRCAKKAFATKTCPASQEKAPGCSFNSSRIQFARAAIEYSATVLGLPAVSGTRWTARHINLHEIRTGALCPDHSIL